MPVLTKINTNVIADDAVTGDKLGTIQSVGETAPSSPFIGQRWYRASTAVTYQYTNDGTSSFWLDVSSGGIGTSANRGVDFVGDIDPHKATNGSGLAVGSVYYNREKNRHFVCTDNTSGANVWSGRYAGASGIVTDYLSGSTYYRSHTFLSSGTFSVEDAMNIDIMVVAGGGGGGWDVGGGGGAGGMGVWENYAVTTQNYDVIVGRGGNGSINNMTIASNGGSSRFGTLTIMAGGGGGGTLATTSAVGGSAGGPGGHTGANQPAMAGAGTIGTLSGTTYGGGLTVDTIGKYFGGDSGAKISGASNYQGAGGGGAGGNGGNGIQHGSGSSNTDNHGIGLNNWFRTGSNVMYAEGGGGGTDGAFGYGRPPTANTGDGAGGDGTTNGLGTGADGIVVVRYALS